MIFLHGAQEFNATGDYLVLSQHTTSYRGQSDITVIQWFLPLADITFHPDQWHSVLKALREHILDFGLDSALVQCTPAARPFPRIADTLKHLFFLMQSKEERKWGEKHWL